MKFRHKTLSVLSVLLLTMGLSSCDEILDIPQDDNNTVSDLADDLIKENETNKEESNSSSSSQSSQSEEEEDSTSSAAILNFMTSLLTYLNDVEIDGSVIVTENIAEEEIALLNDDLTNDDGYDTEIDDGSNDKEAEGEIDGEDNPDENITDDGEDDVPNEEDEIEEDLTPRGFTTEIFFTGALNIDLNSLFTMESLTDLDLSLDLDATVSNTEGSYLPFGIQYINSTLYAEYNRGLENEIDMYMEMASLDNIWDVLELFGINMSSDDLTSSLDIMAILEVIMGVKYLDNQWVMDIDGTNLYLSGTSEGNFTGDIYCEVVGEKKTTMIDLSLTPNENLSYYEPSRDELDDWVPLGLLIESAANTLNYNYYEIMAEYLTINVNYSLSVLGYDINLADIDLGLSNLEIKLLIDEDGKLKLAMDFDVDIVPYTLLGITILTITGVNNEEHYRINRNSTNTFYSTSVDNIHCRIYYDGEYIYMEREDSLTLNTALLFGTKVEGTDYFYGKYTLEGFGEDIMDILLEKIFAMNSTVLDLVMSLFTSDDSDDSESSSSSAMTIDETKIKYEDLLSDFSYTNNEEGEQFHLGAGLSSLIISPNSDGSYSSPIPNAEISIGLSDYEVEGEEETSEKRISDIYVGATDIYDVLGLKLPLVVDYTNAGDVNCEGAIALLQEMAEYALEHEDDPINDWVYDLCYPEDDPYSS